MEIDNDNPDLQRYGYTDFGRLLLARNLVESGVRLHRSTEDSTTMVVLKTL